MLFKALDEEKILANLIYYLYSQKKLGEVQ